MILYSFCFLLAIFTNFLIHPDRTAERRRRNFRLWLHGYCNLYTLQRMTKNLTFLFGHNCWPLHHHLKIDSCNCLSPVPRQTITRNNVYLLLIELSRTFNLNLNFHSKTCIRKRSCKMYDVFLIKIDGLVQHCNISSALIMEILQSCTKPSKWTTLYGVLNVKCCIISDMSSYSFLQKIKQMTRWIYMYVQFIHMIIPSTSSVLVVVILRISQCENI